MDNSWTALLQRLELAPGTFLDHTILITGAAQGIGAALATAVAHLGAHVILVDRNPSVVDVARRLEASGGSARAVVCDLTDERALDRVLTANEIDLSSVTILVNNAMIAMILPVEGHTVDDWDRIFATNVRAPFQILRWAIPRLRAKSGVICNILSAEGTPGSGVYGASKAALRSLTLSLAREQSPDSTLRIFGFAPAITATESVLMQVIPTLAAIQGISEQAVRKSIAQNPGYDDLMPPMDCAATIAFFLAHASEYHGQIVEPFEPLIRFGHIAPISAPTSATEHVTGIPDNLRTYIRETVELNQLLERRVEGRTKKLRELASVDGLTGLFNRRTFDKHMEGSWDRAMRLQKPLSLYVIDVDHFKEYNDRFGHQLGDECLCFVTSVVSQCFKRNSDLVARYGGDELMVIAIDQDRSSCQARAHELIALFNKTEFPQLRQRVSISLGFLNHIPAPGQSVHDLLASADRALYRSKQNGRNQATEGTFLASPANTTE